MSRHRSTWILVAFLLLLTSCTSPRLQNATTVSTRSPTNVPTATSTPILSIPTVGPVPRTCPLSNPARHIFPQLSPVIGSMPVWATWISGPSVYREGPVTSSNPPTNYDPKYGWEMTKVVWEVGPNYTHPVTVRGHDLFDHYTPLLIQFLDSPPTANAVLDPQHPDHPVSVVGGDWAEWGSYIVVPKAGCYFLDVSWPTGHWTVTFAFGA